MEKRISPILTLLGGMALLWLAACGGHNDKEVGDTLKEIERTHEVKIAVHPYNIPFEFGFATSVQGIGADVGEEIAKTLKTRITWAKTDSFEQVFNLIEKGEAHMAISSISVTEDRKARGFLFSQPYYTDSGQTIAAITSDKNIKKLEDLAGKKVGVQENTTGQKYLESKNLTGIQIEKFRTHDDGLLKLSSGEINAFVGDKPIISYIIFKSYQKRLHTVGDLLTHEPYAVMTKDPNLLKVINETIARLDKDGKLKEIVQKWFADYEAFIIKQQRDKAAADKAASVKASAPKTVVFHFSSSKFPLDRLDGHQIRMSGPGGSFTSSHITTSGKSGSCSIGRVPPGNYQASLGVIRWNGGVTVPADGSSSVTVNLNF